MIIGIPREGRVGERRVAATPESAKALIEMGFTVCVAENAGLLASFPDSSFEQVGGVDRLSRSGLG